MEPNKNSFYFTTNYLGFIVRIKVMAEELNKYVFLVLILKEKI